MTTGKDIFLDKSIRTGGFCELAIQVCPSIDNEPIRLYTEFIWTLKNVYGPFDTSFNSTKTDVANIEHEGILHLNSHVIPFKTYNIREDNPVETGFNWFDICFYEGTINKVFGREEHQTWSEDTIIPIELKNFLCGILKNFFKIHPFQLAIIGFEVSGQYYLGFV